MQSGKHHVDMNYYSEDMEAFAPVRPEPFLPDRVSVYEIGASNPTEGRLPDPDTRTELAAAFGEAGRAVDPATAHDQTRVFYRSSGHPWTRGLGR